MIRLLILDVTEMSGQNICVAGFDLQHRIQVRLSHPTPTRSLITTFGGLIPKDVIEVEWRPLPRLERPHVEDGFWEPSTLRKLGHLSQAGVRQLIDPASFDSVQAAFGASVLKGANGNHAWAVGQGERSLASIRVRYTRMDVDREGRPRVAFRDVGGGYFPSVPLQDLIVKSHRQSCDGCGSDYLRRLRSEFDSNAGVLRLGLTRPFGNSETETGCWLQVTNILSVDRCHFSQLPPKK